MKKLLGNLLGNKKKEQEVEIILGWETSEESIMYSQSRTKFFMATAVSPQLTPAEKVERIKKFLRRERLLSELKSIVSYLIPNRSDIKLVLNPSGGSFTDGKTITLGVPEFMQDSTEEEIYIVLRALLAHEAQHIKSSNFILYKDFIENVVKFFGQKDAELKDARFKGILQHIATSYGNGIEDGRIERIAIYVRPGYLRYFKFLRGLWWKAQPVQDDNELMNFLWAVVTLATTGLYPKGFDDKFAGTPIHLELQRVEARIIHATGTRTAADCLRACLELIEESADLMIPLIKAMTPEEQNSFPNTLPPEWTTSDEEETNESGQNESGQGQGQGQGQSGQGQGQPTPSPVHFEKPQGQQSQGGQDGQGGKSGASDKGNEASQGGQGSQASQSGVGDSPQDSDDAQTSPTDQNRKSRGGSNLSPTNSWGNGDDVEEPIDEKALDEMLSNILSELDDDVQNVLNEKAAAKIDNAVGAASGLSKQEVAQIVKESKLGDAQIQIVQRETKPLALPPEINSKAKRFRTDVEHLFKNKSTRNLLNQTSGKLDKRNLYKLGLKQAGVMKKMGRKSTTDYVGYIIRDESGSMGGQKNVDSAHAIAIAEEGLKHVIPLKIMGFRTASGGIHHTVIKDFDDRDKKNYMYAHLKQKSVGGGNADGVAIRVATEELMRRPEKDKVLFIFSDGLPSAYHNDSVGIADVREAIRAARRKGIKVFCIMFGSEDDRNSLENSYREMYGLDVISCPSHMIEKHLKSRLINALKF